MKEFFTIGEISRMFQISPSLLRHYEKLKILVPEYIDKQNGYRYYSTEQFERIHTIRYLRLLDTPLGEIETFVNDQHLQSITDLLSQQKMKVQEKIRELQKVEARIDRRIRQLDELSHFPMDEIFLGVIPEQEIVCFQEKIKPDEAHKIGPIAHQAELNQSYPLLFLGKVGIGISLENLIQNRFDEYDEVFVLLDPEDEAYGEILRVPPRDCIGIRFLGDHTKAELYYQRLAKEIQSREYEIMGSSQEMTLIDAGDPEDSKDYITEIRIPIRRKGKQDDRNTD